MNTIITAILLPIIVGYLAIGIIVAKLDSDVDEKDMVAGAILLWPMILFLKIYNDILEWCIE